MRKKFSFYLIVILLSGTLPLFSQSEGAGKVILEELIQEAIENNTKVLAAQNQWKAALKRVPQAKLRFERDAQGTIIALHVLGMTGEWEVTRKN